MKFFLLGAQPNSLTNFRGALIEAVKQTGAQVTALASAGDIRTEIKLGLQGVRFLSYSVHRNGMNPWHDCRTYLALITIFWRERPNCVLAYTIKPVIWGGLALWLFPRTQFFALISGLGYAFQPNVKRGWVTYLVSFLYRLSLMRAEKVIFQNEDNLNEFVNRGIIPREKCERVFGSGVDLSHFTSQPLPAGTPIFLCIGRLLGDKGIHEYIQAAKIVHMKYANARFQWLGGLDRSPDGIALNQVKQWQCDGVLEYLGEVDDVRPYLTSCHIFVLPSYHEGLPRSTLEAMATGRPIISTDAPGCRDTVIAGKNGTLVSKANADALAECMIWYIENSDKWESMGHASREFAEERFDVNKVNAEMLRIMRLK